MKKWVGGILCELNISKSLISKVDFISLFYAEFAKLSDVARCSANADIKFKPIF
jgi:hypothetical protein